MHHAHHAVVEGLPPLVVGEIFERALSARADRVDERVELAVPPFTDLVEHTLDGFSVPGIGHQSERIGTSAVGQVLRCPLEDVLRPPDERHPRRRRPCSRRLRIPSRDHRRQRLRWRPSARDPPLTIHLSPDFARKPYYRSYSRRARKWRAPSTGWLPVRLTVTAERRHACEDAVQTVAAGRFKSAKL